MQPKEFLNTVVTSPAGYFCLALKTEGPWIEHFYKWPDDVDKILTAAAELRERGNVYFSAHLFSEPRSQKKYVLPSRTLQADLDEADINTLSVLPTVLVKTSPGRHQAFWVLDKELAPADIEKHARRIAYGVPDCDRTGWTAGHKVRMPHTYNYKRPPAKPLIEIAGTSFRELKLDVLNAFPELKIDEKQAAADVDWIENDPDELPVSTVDLLTSLRTVIPAKVFSQYVKPAKDRSAALWAFNTECLRAGCSREQVFWLAKGNANNKFADRPSYAADRDLRRDILRAEQALETKQLDLKAICMDLRRRGNKSTRERAEEISRVVLSHMREHGEFVHAKSGLLWYLRKDTGRPVVLTVHSEWLLGYLNHVFGLNITESYTKFVVHDLQTYCQQVPQSSDLQALSYYDTFTSKLMLHTGGRDVLHISKDSVEIHPNGFGSVVFQWLTNYDTWTLDKPMKDAWHEWLFGLHTVNVMGLTREESLAIWRAWLLFLLFKNMATSRPLLALVGQPGCLSGDTVLYLRRGKHSAREYSIADAYKRLQEAGYHGWSGPRGKGTVTRIQSLKDSTIAWRNIKNVVYSGKKHTYTVYVNGHVPFRVTDDHRFLTPDGYRALRDIRPGQSVVVQGAHCTSNGTAPADRREVSVKYHPAARWRTVDGYGPYGFVEYYRIVLEAHLNNIPVERFLRILRLEEGDPSSLVFVPVDHVIHHKNGDATDHSPNNLETLSKIEHDRLHGQQANLGYYSGLYETTTAIVDAIEYYGVEDTYDIEMEDASAPNFLVNEVVVHNSGKTVLAKKLYKLVYGAFKNVSGLSGPDEFDLSMGTLPLVAYDNLDTWSAWLPDRLAMATSDTDVEKRKLYTDLDQVVFRRHAMLILTAHNPRFTREDVVDRLLLFQFSRLTHFESESEMLAAVLEQRNRLWTSIVRDVQKVLATPRPKHSEVPQFRIEDYAYLGLWFSRAHGPQTEAAFKSGVAKIQGGQRTMTLEQDQLLVSALHKYVEADKGEAPYRKTDAIYSRLMLVASDPAMLQRQFKTPLHLAKKLWVMQESLRQVFKVEWKYDDNNVSKLWLIAPKEPV